MGACPMSHCCGRVGFVCAGHSALGSAWLRTSMFKWRDATVYLMGLRYGHAWPNTVIAYARDATSVWSITRDVTDRSTFIDCRSFCFWSGRLTFELFSFRRVHVQFCSVFYSAVSITMCILSTTKNFLSFPSFPVTTA